MKRKMSVAIVGIFFTINLTSCAAMEKIDRTMTQRARDQMDRWREEHTRGESWGKKYLNVLYFEMPESKFLELFTKTSSWTDPERPYITKHVGNRYILAGPTSSYDYRVTFENGKLIKFEYHGHGGGGNPFGYNDYTFLLRKAK